MAARLRGDRGAKARPPDHQGPATNPPRLLARGGGDQSAGRPAGRGALGKRNRTAARDALASGWRRIADRRPFPHLKRRAQRRWRDQQRLSSWRRSATSSAATTRRISSPTANICRCDLCSPRSACRGSRPATSIFTRGRARRPSRCPETGARSASSSATKSSFPAKSSTAPHRPDFIFNPSNDAWFGRWGPPQHLAQARLRAAEEGLPVIRSTPTGISALIDADGRVVQSLPWQTAGVIDASLPPPQKPDSIRALRQHHPAGTRLPPAHRRDCAGPEPPLQGRHIKTSLYQWTDSRSCAATISSLPNRCPKAIPTRSPTRSATRWSIISSARIPKPASPARPW